MPYPYPYPYNSDQPLASQWSPVSVTFESKPHVLVKRSRSMKSIGHDERPRSKFEDDDDTPEDRTSKLLSVVILPLSRRKSKSSLHRSPEASPSSSETSSISSRTPSPTKPIALKRSASLSQAHSRPRYRETNRIPKVPPLPTNIPPVPKVPESATHVRLPKRSRTPDPASVARRPLTMHSQPAVSNVEGYWDHIQLFSDSPPVPPLPRQYRSSPTSF
ncbi:hypothetical protein PM082_021437 [Marasmius tenuissimus]|nr:hypothetical protein PM082_021437 [Marasmius tenuissimus]